MGEEESYSNYDFWIVTTENNSERDDRYLDICTTLKFSFLPICQRVSMSCFKGKIDIATNICGLFPDTGS